MSGWLKKDWCSHQPIGRNYSDRPAGIHIDAIVLHYTTAGHYLNTLSWFKNLTCHSSAHFVVGRQGEVIQLVPLDKKAWHAGDGEMTYAGEMNADPNRFSLGIEIANHGLLEQLGDGFATDWGLAYSLIRYPQPEEATLHFHDGSEVKGFWEPYPSLQVGAVRVLCQALIDLYAIPLNRIVGHQDIALDESGCLGLKKDPGPLWPWAMFLEGLHGQPGDGTRYRRTRP